MAPKFSRKPQDLNLLIYLTATLDLPLAIPSISLSCSPADMVGNETLVNGKPSWYSWPALTPPPGVESNFVDPYTLKPVVFVITGICITLTTFGIGARLMVRKRTNESMLLEDCWCCMLSCLDGSRLTSTRLVSVCLGMFKPSCLFLPRLLYSRHLGINAY